MTKESFIAVVAFGIILVIAAGVFFITPSLTPESIAQRHEADKHIARAERALAAFSQGFSELEAAERQLGALGMPANAGDIDDLESAINAGDLVGEATSTVQQLGRAVQSQSPRPPSGREEQWAALGYSPALVETWFTTMAGFGGSEKSRMERIGDPVAVPDWAQQAGGAPSAGKIKTLWQSLAADRKENQKLLDAAEAAAKEALAVSAGDLRAGRLLGMTHLQRARLAQRDALVTAALASPLRRRAIDVAGQVRELMESEADYVERRKLQDAIDLAVAERDEVSSQLDAAKAEQQRLDDELRDLNARVADALEEVRSARDALDALTQSGYVADQHGPFAAYVNSVKAASEVWREKSLAYQALAEGTMQGDEARLGVGPVERELALTEKRVEVLTARLGEAEADLEAVNTLRQSLDSAGDQRRRQINELRAELQSLIDEEDRLSAEARALEEAAADKHAEAALRQFAAARAAAAGWTQPPIEGEADPEITSKKSQDRWIEALIHADQAVATLQKMSVHLQRVADLKNRLPMVQAAADAGIREMQPGTVEEQIAAARRAGLDAVEKAFGHIETAQNRDNEWYYETLAGSALFGRYLLDPDDPQRAQTLEDAMQAFRDAINGRETSRFAAPYQRVLQSMQVAASG